MWGCERMWIVWAGLCRVMLGGAGLGGSRKMQGQRCLAEMVVQPVTALLCMHA